MAGASSLAGSKFDSAAYLPGALYHLEQSKALMEAGDYQMSTAHSRMVLHDQGLQVFVSDDDNKMYRKAAEKAVSFWNETLGEGALVITENRDEAKVSIIFEREVTLNGTPVGGYCAQSRSIGYDDQGQPTPLYRATIMTRTMVGRHKLNEACLVNIIAHEIGHVYGLNDCTDQGHLMSALNLRRPKFELDDDELEALQQFRLTAFEILRSTEAAPKQN